MASQTIAVQNEMLKTVRPSEYLKEEKSCGVAMGEWAPVFGRGETARKWECFLVEVSRGYDLSFVVLNETHESLVGLSSIFLLGLNTIKPPN